MKKVAVLLITLFTALLCVNAATYTIRKDGGIRNSNGNIQNNTSKNPQNQYPVNRYPASQPPVNSNYNGSNDVIYTKAQDSENEQTQPEQTQIEQSEIKQSRITKRNTTSPDIEAEKINNLQYLQRPAPIIDLDNIVKNHLRDYDVEINRQAVCHKTKSAKGCVITTFSGMPIYSVSRCTNDENHGYFYASFKNPMLIGFTYTEHINPNLYIMYKYSFQYNNWTLKDVTISYRYPGEPLKQFIYKKVNGAYVLNSFYIDNNNYSPDGKLQHTRTLWWEEQ